MSRFRQAFIGAGSNLGDREGNILQALEHLRSTEGVRRADLSPLYETAPVGVTDQPDFLNAVIGIETALPPETLLEKCLEIERSMGRVRRERWGPRLIDLDLLLYEDETRESAALTLPHPRFRERPFVTTPLRDLLTRPEYARPCWRELASDLAALSPDPTVRRVSDT